jgi:hypothetical protein
LRVVARTVPLRQWEVQRELTERLKTALDEAGLADSSGVVSGTEAGAGAVVPAGAQPLAYPPSAAGTPPSPATAQGTLGDASVPGRPRNTPDRQ